MVVLYVALGKSCPGFGSIWKWTETEYHCKGTVDEQKPGRNSANRVGAEICKGVDQHTQPQWSTQK